MFGYRIVLCHRKLLIVTNYMVDSFTYSKI